MADEMRPVKKKRSRNKFLENYWRDSGDFRNELPSYKFEELAQMLLDHFDSVKHFKLSDFLRKQGIPPRTYHYWRSKSEPLSNAHDIVMYCKAESIMYKALARQYDGQFARFVLPQIHDSFKDLHKFHSENNKQNKDEGPAKLVVHMDSFGNEKKEEGDE